MRCGILLIIVAAVSFGRASACSCVEYKTIEDHIGAMDAIFYGTAIGTEWAFELENGFSFIRTTKFEVGKVLKGDVPKADFDKPEYISVRHEQAVSGNCGINFLKGYGYHIFATRDEGGHFYTGSCHRTRMAPPLVEWTWDEYRAALGAN